MATRRVIKGVLGNFLSTYVSRNSDYDGYWLFGFLVRDLDELIIDLLGQNVNAPDSPKTAAVFSAAAKFEDQGRKAGLAPSQVRRAWLKIRRLPNMESGWINGHPCAGFKLRFLAEAVMNDGSHYERERVVFVAPHDPKVEWRSLRAI